jgi:hypothetical protein
MAKRQTGQSDSLPLADFFSPVTGGGCGGRAVKEREIFNCQNCIKKEGSERNTLQLLLLEHKVPHDRFGGHVLSGL